jgi:rhodanese-related sulfurtransferase
MPARADLPSEEEMRQLHEELPHVTCAELARWLADGRICTVLDVRTAPEWLSRRIPGAVLVPLHELPARVDEALGLPGPLVVHCEHGIRSVDASLYLRWQGRQDVYNVREGLAAWEGPAEHGPLQPGPDG